MKEILVTVPCANIVELNEYFDWLQKNKLYDVGYKWTTVDNVQCVSIYFTKEKDAMFFTLRWS